MKQQIKARLALVIAIAALLLSGLVYNSISPAAEAQVSTRFRSIQVDHSANIDGNLAVAGTTAFAGDFDLNGNKLDLDADADTSITADTDDQIDFEIGGADEVSLTAATLDLNDTYVDQTINTENIGALPSIATVSITYTAAAGGNGTVATVGDGEIWIVHKVLVNVTTDFDTTGDDATLVIGDGNDADGFIVLADTELQAADTEGTGFAAGWQGQAAATIGDYLDANENGFVYAPDGAPETIDYLIDETSGETLTAGAATIYIVYTRLQ